MHELKAGQFYGTTNQRLALNGLILTDTEYTLPNVDWHYHELPYFTFILRGHLLEGNKKEVYKCSPGDLLFHHWQEPHYNEKPNGLTRGFQLELQENWLKQYDLPANLLEGSSRLKDPRLKMMMYNIYREMKLGSLNVSAAIDSKLILLMTSAADWSRRFTAGRPAWVNRIEAMLLDSEESHLFTLGQLATVAGVHPVYLSRSFSFYFGTSLGDYLRLLKIQRALYQLPETSLSLSRIALNCGFFDQSHFIRQFKSACQLTPLAYRKLFSKG